VRRERQLIIDRITGIVHRSFWYDTDYVERTTYLVCNRHIAPRGELWPAPPGRVPTCIPCVVCKTP